MNSPKYYLEALYPLQDNVDNSKIIKTFPKQELGFIRWAFDVDFDEVYKDLQIIAKNILLGENNTLKVDKKS